MGILRTAGFVDYDVRLKDLFFDRRRVINAVDKMTHNVLNWYGGKVRERTRGSLGNPKFQKWGSRRSGSYALDKPPRPAPNPPIPRVSKSSTVSLRNVQYHFRQTNDGGTVKVFIPKFRNTQRHGGKTAPEIQEFGGTVRARAKVLAMLPPTERARRSKKMKQRRNTLIFSPRFPMRSCRIPARPYLGANMSLKTGKTGFERAIREGKKRLAEGKYPFNIGRLGRGRIL